MNRSIVIVVVLGLMAPFLAHAEERSLCASMCSSEKRQCTSRAAKLTELDNLPSVEEKNPFARTANMGQVTPEPARVGERLSAQRRGSERVGACDASYKRCSSACGPLVAPVVEQGLPAK